MLLPFVGHYCGDRDPKHAAGQDGSQRGICRRRDTGYQSG